MNSRLFWSLVLAAAMVLWSTSGVLARVLKVEHPMVISGVRGLYAVGVFALIMWQQRMLSGKRIAWLFAALVTRRAKSEQAKRKRRKTAGLHWALVGTGALTSGMFIASTVATNAATGMVLLQMAPIFVNLAAPFITGEKPRLRDWAAAILVLAGVSTLAIDHLHLHSFIGVMCGVCGGISWGCTILLQRRIVSIGARLQAGMLSQAVLVLAGIPFVAACPPHPSSSLYLVLAGTLGLGIPAVIFTWAVPKVGSSFRAVVITGLEPVAAVTLAYLFLGEIPGPWCLLGGSLITVTIFAHASLSLWRKR
jgi:drug/metabolite transporter (DMT)-like permease